MCGGGGDGRCWVRRGEDAAGKTTGEDGKGKTKQWAQVKRFFDSMVKSRWRWSEHVRRDTRYVKERTLKLDLPGKSERGIPRSRFLNMVRAGIRALGVRADGADDRRKWKQINRFCNPMYE